MVRRSGGAGRKRGRGEARDNLVSAWIDDATMAALRREARRKEWTLSRVAAERLKESLIGSKG